MNGSRSEIEPIDGLAQFNTTYGDMTVNAYLVWDPKSREAAAFDTGADASEMLKRAAVEDLSFMMILLTHAHPDHIADLNSLCSGSGAPVYAPEHEPVADAKIIGEGDKFELGSLYDRSATDLRPFARWIDVRRARTRAAGGDRRRFDVCRIDGRRRCFLQRRAPQQSREDPDAAR